MADIERPRSERYFKIDTAVLAPGHDWLSKSTTGPFVDTKVDVQFAERGRIYLNIDTIRELAVASGILDEYFEKVDAAYHSGYNTGYAEAVKENYGSAITDAVDRLAFVAGQLGLVVAPGADADSDAGGGGESPAHRDADSQQSSGTRRRGRGTARDDEAPRL